MNPEDIYTPIEKVREILNSRRQDKFLLEKVSIFLKGRIPITLVNEPKAVLPRAIVSPDNEHIYFLELAKKIDLKPSSWEYLKDKFFTINEDKLCLGKMSFAMGNIEDSQVVNKKILNFKEAEGKPFTEIKTLWGENLIDFHHRILDKSGYGIELFDGSDWYRSFGDRSSDYYVYYLAVFLCYGVLFENFICDNKQHPAEDKFTKNVLFPALKQIEAIFGMKPLIVKLLPKESEDKIFWWCYPESDLIKEIDNLIKI